MYVPKDKPIFFPILNSECSPIEYPSIKSDEGLKKCAKTFQDMAKGLKASLDGKPLPVIRIATDIFNFTLPGNNIFGTSVINEEPFGQRWTFFICDLIVTRHSHFKIFGLYRANFNFIK